MNLSDFASLVPGPFGTIMKVVENVLPSVFGQQSEPRLVTNSVKDPVSQLRNLAVGSLPTAVSSYLSQAGSLAGQVQSMHMA